MCGKDAFPEHFLNCVSGIAASESYDDLAVGRNRHPLYRVDRPAMIC